jgi:hypothetical protein
MVSIFVSMAATACSNTGANGPAFLPLAGIYSATFGMTATSTAGTDVLNAATGTITLTNAAPDRTFSGSFVEGASSGTVFGIVQVDGDLDISEFGYPDDTPFTDLEALRQQLPGCAFGHSVPDGTTGTLTVNQLVITGGITLPCVWDVSGTQETLLTTITVTVTGSR